MNPGGFVVLLKDPISSGWGSYTLCAFSVFDFLGAPNKGMPKTLHIECRYRSGADALAEWEPRLEIAD